MQAFTIDEADRHDHLPDQVGEGGVGYRRRSHQALGERTPPLRHLGQDREGGPDVLAAFGVVRGQRRHRPRLATLADVLAGMEIRRRQPELRRIAADLVRRDEP